jgi:hypothetical protein
MQCIREIVECNEMDAHNDIYPCNCGKFHKAKNPLISAIDFLQLDRLKELLYNIPVEDILNKDLWGNENTKRKTNILSYILVSLMSSGFSKFPCLNCISYSNMNTTNPYNTERDIQIRDQVLKIIEYICSKYPKLIADHWVETAISYGSNLILAILLKYYDDDDDSLERCNICYSNCQIQLIDYPCECKMKVHLTCLINIIEALGDNICRVCHKSYNAGIDHRHRIFFPFANIYASKLMSSYEIIPFENKLESLYYAIEYLQIERTKEILETMTKEEWDEYKKRNNDPRMGLYYYVDGEFQLKEAINLPKKYYEKEYKAINKMLLKKENEI